MDLIAFKGIGIIVLPKQDYFGRKQVVPPNVKERMNIHHLANSYRQAEECHKAHLYITSHYLDRKISNTRNFDYQRKDVQQANLQCELEL